MIVASSAVHAVVEQSHRRTLVLNECPERGMNYSLRLGLDTIAKDRAVAVLLADMPFVDRTLLERLLVAFTDASDVLFPTYAGAPGHPVIFGPRTRRRLYALEGGDGIRSVRDALEFRRLAIPIDRSAVSIDVDTRADLAAIQTLNL